MLASLPNSEIIRIAIIVIFAVVTLLSRFAKKTAPPRPTSSPGTSGTTPWETLRQAMRQGAEQGRPIQQPRPFQVPPPQLRDSFNQPPATQPESSFLPSLLLLALFVCLCLIAYRYFAR